MNKMTNDNMITETQKPKGSLSKDVFDIDWEKNFPHSFTKKLEDKTSAIISFEYVTIDICQQFIAEHFDEIFPKEKMKTPFKAFQTNLFKERYYHKVIDPFVIKFDNHIAGFFLGNMLDWETYYLRYINILPQYRGSKISVDFYAFLFEVLKSYQIKQIEAHVAVDDSHQAQKLLQLGFLSGGTILSVRWGTLSRYIKYFDLNYSQCFSNQFCF